MTTNLVESFDAWLRDEQHHFICSFLGEHMTKLGAILVRHKAESNQWKGSIEPKIYQKVKINIAKGEVYTVNPFSESIFGVFILQSSMLTSRSTTALVEPRKCLAYLASMHVQ